MSYKILLFDLDDTLLDFGANETDSLGTAVDGIEWENQYRELLGNGSQHIEGALEVCQSLSVSHRLFVVTNGITLTQIKRLKLSGLDEFFEDIFDSQSIGFQKPSKEFFDYVISHIKDFNKKEALIIGDSLNTDIKGGLLAGIDTCWINRNSYEKSTEIQSTYTISSLVELYDICTPINGFNG